MIFSYGLRLAGAAEEKELASLKSSLAYAYYAKKLAQQVEDVFGTADVDHAEIERINAFIRDDTTRNGDTFLDKAALKKVLAKIKEEIPNYAIDKTILLQRFFRVAYAISLCSLKAQEKLELLAMLSSEVEDATSEFGQLKKQNSYMRQKNYFIPQATFGLLAGAGVVLASVFLPIAAAVGIIAAASISILGSTLSDVGVAFTNSKVFQRPYGKTDSADGAKLWVQNLTKAMLLCFEEELEESQASQELKRHLEKNQELKRHLEKNKVRKQLLRKKKSRQNPSSSQAHPLISDASCSYIRA